MKNVRSRSSKNLPTGDIEEFSNKYISTKEAATVLTVSPATAKRYMEEGKIPSEITQNGTRMLLREAVYTYAGLFYPETKSPVGTCARCGNQFERKKLTAGRSLDPDKKFYRDGDYCPACRRLLKATKGLDEDVDKLAVKSTYVPHSPGQQAIHDSTARYRIVNAGARWGKDRSCINEFIRQFSMMLNEDRGPDMVPKVHGFLVAPNFPLSRQLWREVKHFFPADWIEQIYEGDKVITTKGGGVIEVKSADDPNALVSVGLDIVQLTEAARIPNLVEAWAYLSGRVNSPGRGPNGQGGIILANSTPRGRGFWSKLRRMGRKGDDLYDPAFEEFNYTTYDNPYINKLEIDRLRKLLPDRIFRQEYLAEELEDADSVFTNIEECACYAGPDEPEQDETYTIGWDPALKVDFSAVIVKKDSTGEAVQIHRWTGKPWDAQLMDIARLSRLFNFAPVNVDVTGIGKTIPESLDKLGIVYQAVHFNAQVKEDLVNNLAFLMEQRAISYPDDENLKRELSDFKYVINEKTGVIKFSAPRGAGYFDDLVTAMMLAFKDHSSSAMELPFMGLLAGVTIGQGMSATEERIARMQGYESQRGGMAESASPAENHTPNLTAVLANLHNGYPIPWESLTAQQAEDLDFLLARRAAKYADEKDPVRAQMCLMEREKYRNIMSLNGGGPA